MIIKQFIHKGKKQPKKLVIKKLSKKSPSVQKKSDNTAPRKKSQDTKDYKNLFQFSENNLSNEKEKIKSQIVQSLRKVISRENVEEEIHEDEDDLIINPHKKSSIIDIENFQEDPQINSKKKRLSRRISITKKKSLDYMKRNSVSIEKKKHSSKKNDPPITRQGSILMNTQELNRFQEIQDNQENENESYYQLDDENDYLLNEEIKCAIDSDDSNEETDSTQTSDTLSSKGNSTRTDSNYLSFEESNTYFDKNISSDITHTPNHSVKDNSNDSEIILSPIEYINKKLSLEKSKSENSNTLNHRKVLLKTKATNFGSIDFSNSELSKKIQNYNNPLEIVEDDQINNPTNQKALSLKKLLFEKDIESIIKDQTNYQNVIIGSTFISFLVAVKKKKKISLI